MPPHLFLSKDNISLRSMTTTASSYYVSVGSDDDESFRTGISTSSHTSVTTSGPEDDDDGGGRTRKDQGKISRQQQRRVRINPHPIVYRHNRVDRDQKGRLWYSKEEYDIIWQMNSLIVELFRRGGFKETDDFSMRGLEVVLQQRPSQQGQQDGCPVIATTDRRTLTKDALQAVLFEQYRQATTGKVCVEKLARASKRASRNHRLAAIQRAMEDAIISRAHNKDVEEPNYPSNKMHTSFINNKTYPCGGEVYWDDLMGEMEEDGSSSTIEPELLSCSAATTVAAAAPVINQGRNRGLLRNLSYFSPQKRQSRGVVKPMVGFQMVPFTSPSQSKDTVPVNKMRSAMAALPSVPL